MSFLKFNSSKQISLISKYRKETQIQENQCIWEIKTNSNVISEFHLFKTNFFNFQIQKRNLD